MTEENYHENIEQAINYRIKIYNSLARDALVILTIQLFVIPLLISTTTLVYQLLESSPENDSGNVFSQLQTAINGVAVFEGLIVLSSAIILTTIIYYDARRRSAKQPKYITQTNEENTDILEIPYKKYLKNKGFGEEVYKRKQVLKSPNRLADEKPVGGVHRVILLISIILSYYTLYIVSTELFSALSQDISEITRYLLLTALIVTILVAGYSPTVVLIEDFIEFMFGVGRKLLVASIDLAESALILILIKSWIQLTEGNKKINLILSFVILFFGSIQFPSGYSNSTYTMLIIFGEFIGISTVYFAAISELDELNI